MFQQTIVCHVRMSINYGLKAEDMRAMRRKREKKLQKVKVCSHSTKLLTDMASELNYYHIH